MYRFPGICINDFYPSDLIYLDSAASALKPICVCNAVHEFYTKHYSNIGRGMYQRAYNNTEKYLETKIAIQKLLTAHNYHVVYTLNTTYAINMIKMMLDSMQNVVISDHEHHSNILPWRDKNTLVLPHHDMHNLTNVDIISMSHCCNVTGQIFPVKQVIKNTPNAIHIIDGAQMIPHAPIDIDDINPDFYVFSPHKAYGPTGIGILLIKKSMTGTISKSGINNANDNFNDNINNNHINTTLNYAMLGGGTVAYVNTENNKISFELLENHEQFEAGTPPIAQAFGTIAAMEYMHKIGMDTIQRHSSCLRKNLVEIIKKMPHIKILNDNIIGVPTVSFTVKNMHSHDVGIMLSEKNIATRVGHMCAQPTVNKYGEHDVIRVSCGVYNDIEDIEYLAKHLEKLKKYA